GAFWLMSRARGQKVEAWHQYLQAASTSDLKSLKTTVDEHAETPAAVSASMHIGLRQLELGNNLLLSDAGEARRSLEDAVKYFGLAREWTSDILVKQVATYQLARAHESLGNLNRATQEYTRLVTGDLKDGALAKEAKDRLDDLSRPATQEYYNWHATARATTPAAPRKRTSRDPEARPLDLPSGPSEDRSSPPPDPQPPSDIDFPPAKTSPEKSPEKSPDAPDTKPAEEKKPAAESKPAEEKPAPPTSEKQPATEPKA
ncbi:MAG: hypothetical protein WD176_07005, partial [Pirellulales bacterium]